MAANLAWRAVGVLWACCGRAVGVLLKCCKTLTKRGKSLPQNIAKKAAQKKSEASQAERKGKREPGEQGWKTEGEEGERRGEEGEGRREGKEMREGEGRRGGKEKGGREKEVPSTSLIVFFTIFIFFTIFSFVAFIITPILGLTSIVTPILTPKVLDLHPHIAHLKHFRHGP